MAVSPEDMAVLARQMRGVAATLLDALDSAQRQAATTTFDRDELVDWTYLPGARPGVRIADLTAPQRDLASQLLLSSFSTRGEQDAVAVLRTESIRRGRDLAVPAATSVLAGYRDPQYWLRILGDPAGADPWAWRISGHHLVAQATVVGDVVAATPQFFGTQPARVLDGPHAGFRGLPREEDLARQLVLLLGEDQRRLAILAPDLPFDIRTRDDPVATVAAVPPGLPYARMDAEQRAVFEELISQYVGRAAAAVSNRAWDDLRQAGLAHVSFGWAGNVDRGHGHYYAVSGPTLLLEYANTQDDANHVHSVWRDLRHDWAGDVLARHYRQHPHPS
ncbi:MAG: DUF3500 domain-containing protein [Propionibacteriaceae bacterium]